MDWLVRVFAAIAFFVAGASMLAAGENHVAFVPWEIIEPQDAVEAPLVLFWVPSAGDEVRHSDLLTSDELMLFSTRCVAMRIVRLTDDVRLAGLEAGTDLPVVVLADRMGQVIGRVANRGGSLAVEEVEDLVRDELDRRADEADELLDRARERSDDGAPDEAIALYQSVWEERCVCPRQGRDAGRALRKLGRK